MTLYRLVYRCSNCRTRYNVDIPFGTEALQNLPCPNCGLSQASPEKEKEQPWPWDGYTIRNEELVKRGDE